jgi:23S rRNA pseudouridine1911/1915/1917 synthase
MSSAPATKKKTPATTTDPLHLVVAAGAPLDRLDKLVTWAFAKREGVAPISRAEAQRWIDDGRVLVDGRVARASTKLNIGTRVAITPALPRPTTAEPDASVRISVVFEDASLIVIDKPPGLVVHPARGHLTGTLVNGLLAHGGFERASADPRDPAGHLRPGIVHRIDKDTSGLLVVAKDAPTREALKTLFARHTIDREYVALVDGEARDATYDSLHARHPTERLRFTTRVKDGRRAVTHVRVLERFAGATLVACRLETGRTHQIRVHLTELGGTPIIADPIYGKPPSTRAIRAAAEAIGRLALHARLLGFVHPTTGATVRFESPTPADFERALVALSTDKRAKPR